MPTGPAAPPPPEIRKEIARLRAIMYEPSRVRLVTAVQDGSRWLSDGYVMLDVTDSPAIAGECPTPCDDDCDALCHEGHQVGYKRDHEPGDHLKDGQYKLIAARGFEPIIAHTDPDEDCKAGNCVCPIAPAELDADAYFDALTAADWQAACPSQWSVAEHPGKAMLFSVHGHAKLMGESTFASLSKHLGKPQVEYAMGLGANVFRFLDGGSVVAYAAGIIIPEGQEEIASAIARLVEVANPC